MSTEEAKDTAAAAPSAGDEAVRAMHDNYVMENIVIRHQQHQLE
jgi:hypothetical protein